MNKVNGASFDIKDPASILKLGQSQFLSSKSARSMVESRWIRSSQLYDSLHPSGEKKISDVLMGQYRLFIPKTYNTVQRMEAEVLETLHFDEDETVSVDSGMDVPLLNRRAVKEILNYRLNSHPINWYEESLEFVQDALKLKVGIFKIYPKLKLSKKDVSKKVKNQDGTYTEMVTQDVSIDAFSPRIDSVSPEDLFLSSEATWKDYFKHPIVHRYVRDRAYLKRCGFQNVDLAPGLKDFNYTDQLKEYRQRSGMASPFYQTMAIGEGEKVMVYEFWTFLDMGGADGYCSATFSLLGGADGPSVLGLPARKNTLPYKYDDFEPVRPPFIIGTAFPEAHKGYGKDLPEIVDGLQTETNILRNQAREAEAVAIRKPLLVAKDAQLDMQQLMNRKIGGVVVGEDVGQDSVRELSQSSPSMNSEPGMRHIDNDFSEATSLYPGQFGASTKDESATGVTTTSANANKKMKLVYENLRRTGFVPALDMLLRLEQAYETDEFIQQVTGQKLGWGRGNDGTPDWRVIQGAYKLSVNTGINKQQQLNRFFLLMDRMNQSNAALGQLVAQGIVDPAKVRYANPMWAFDEIAKTLQYKNLDELKLEAKAPPPAEQAPAGGPKGLASPPKNSANPQQELSANPEEFLNGLL